MPKQYSQVEANIAINRSAFTTAAEEYDKAVACSIELRNERSELLKQLADINYKLMENELAVESATAAIKNARATITELSVKAFPILSPPVQEPSEQPSTVNLSAK